MDSLHFTNPIYVDTIERAFDTNPSNVYGILVVVLLIAVGVLWTYIIINERWWKNKLIELNSDTIKVITAVTGKIEHVTNELQRLSAEVDNLNQNR